MSSDVSSLLNLKEPCKEPCTCCSVLQCAAACCSVLQCVAVCPVKSPVLGGSSAKNDLQLKASCGSSPPCISDGHSLCHSDPEDALSCRSFFAEEPPSTGLFTGTIAQQWSFPLPFGEWHSRMVQCVVVRCSTLQCVAVCCSVLHCVRMLYLERSFSRCHSGNGIREWSGNRCVFAFPREFSFPFPFTQNSLGGGGDQSLQSRFSPPQKNKRNGWSIDSDSHSDLH